MGELSERMTALEEAHWIAKCRDFPLPNQQIVVHLAQIAQYIQNANVAKKEDRGKLTDFMLFFRKKVMVQENVDQNIRSIFGKLKKDK